jgi:glyoxalase-like protein
MGDARPAVVTDHVLVAVADLEAGAQWIESEYGLRAVPGGRHPGAGTANMIVPLGSAYLELIGVVDPEEAGRSPTSVRITRALAEGRRFATWAARTDNLDALRGHLLATGWQLEAPRQGSRVRQDGVLLRWRTQFLAPVGAPSVLPFVIEWSVPPGMHPGEMPADHPSGARGIRSVRLGDPDPAAAAERLQSALGANLNASVERAASSGVVAVEIDTPKGVVVLR